MRCCPCWEKRDPATALLISENSPVQDDNCVQLTYPEKGTSTNVVQLTAKKVFAEWEKKENTDFFSWLQKVHAITPFQWRAVSDGQTTVEVMDMCQWSPTLENIFNRTLKPSSKVLTNKNQGTLFKELKSPSHGTFRGGNNPFSAQETLAYKEGNVLWGKRDDVPIAVIVPETIYNIDGQERHFVVVHKTKGFEGLNADDFHQCLVVVRKVVSVFNGAQVRIMIGGGPDGTGVKGKTFSVEVLIWDEKGSKTIQKTREIPAHIEQLRAKLFASPPSIL